MFPQDVLCALLRSPDSKYQKNVLFLKKIIATCFYGRLMINDLLPDDQYSLADYLLDNENIILDYSRLSEAKKQVFVDWLLKPHEEEKDNVFLHRVGINNYRGYLAEVELSTWGKIKSWFSNEKFESWQLADPSLSLNYQLMGLNIRQDSQGILLGFEHFLPPAVGGKYANPDSPNQAAKGNNKRVYITDKLVDRLKAREIASYDFDDICKNPHPQSVYVDDRNARYEKMHAYRASEQFVSVKPWYLRLFNWIVEKVQWLFQDKTAQEERPVSDPAENAMRDLMYKDKVRICQRRKNGQILVIENRPDVEILVYSGGGAKIFGHLGVYEAFCQAGIRPKKYAGSSAGAIMALLCYLGYDADEIKDFFYRVRPEHITNYEPSREGISDTAGLKSALDYMITKKVYQICQEYNIDLPEQNVIKYGYLHQLQKQCPESGLGEMLVIPATDKESGKIRYFSHEHDPDAEVSLSVVASACLPRWYKPVQIGDAILIDAGLTSNFPTEAYPDDNSTFLESEHGNNLKLVAVQFNTGTERNTIHRIRDRIYRENPLVNFIYRILTGIDDPASSWEQDRLKLRKHALQTILVDTDLSMVNLSPSDEEKQALISSGLNSGTDYIRSRYGKKSDRPYANCELMYDTFDSLYELLVYCCYREDYEWFKEIKGLIEQSQEDYSPEMLMKVERLEALYFQGRYNQSASKAVILYQNSYSYQYMQQRFIDSALPFLSIYPLFLLVTREWFKEKSDIYLFEQAMKDSTVHFPFKCLDYLSQQTGEVHLLFHIIYQSIKKLHADPHPENYESLRQLNHCLPMFFDKQEDFYSQWRLRDNQIERLIALMNDAKENPEHLVLMRAQLLDLCRHYKNVNAEDHELSNSADALELEEIIIEDSPLHATAPTG